MVYSDATRAKDFTAAIREVTGYIGTPPTAKAKAGTDGGTLISYDSTTVLLLHTKQCWVRRWLLIGERSYIDMVQPTHIAKFDEYGDLRIATVTAKGLRRCSPKKWGYSGTTRSYHLHPEAWTQLPTLREVR